MKYYSTRDKSNIVTAAQAIVQGLASDGGLFVPETIPAVSASEIEALCKMGYRERAVAIMGKYLDEFSKEELSVFVSDAYADNYDCTEIAPTRILNDNTGVLELWHGPTCAFKDMALQMLPRLLTASLKKLGETRKVCILVATSGDTGKAALEGFADVEGTSIVVFYPRDGVSDVQKLQMTTQRGENVFVSAVEGNFDDAQTGVKLIFSDREFAKKLDENGVFLSSANSINWGRLLPQVVYYFSAYCDYVNSGKIKMGDEIDFCVPTGNFGDILAGWYAKKMGLPVRRLICASNRNNVLTDFINTGVYDRNREFFATISPSMDILVSSNLERLLFMLTDDASVKGWMDELKTVGEYDVGAKVLKDIQADFDCGFTSDEQAKACISELFKSAGYLMDTHTADAYAVLADKRNTGEIFPTVIVSTASPYKFSDSVLEAFGEDSSKSGAKLIEKLSAVTGTAAPKPLTGLDGREVRFNNCTSKEEMPNVVMNFLS
ncbi:MAG: threonine synthase [Oscillospiraceae bacterium]|nr:threonine synthase [Oscillospiraceae bacterium]